MKQRNPYHKTLTHFKHKVVPSKKIYNRKKLPTPTRMESCDIFATQKNYLHRHEKKS